VNVIIKIPGRNCEQIQPYCTGRKWLGLHRNQKRNLGIETSRITSKSNITKMLGTIWLLPRPAHTRYVVTLKKSIAFSLIVDDFAVKYVGKHHADHLRDALLRNYELTTDWEGKVYSGMSFKWDYKNRTCDIFMPGYVSNVLNIFQHDAPKHPHQTPSKYGTPMYGDKTQYATQDDTPPLTAKQCLNIQKVTGSILYYAKAVDPTVFIPLNDITIEQTKATEKTQAATNQLLDYLATHMPPSDIMPQT
jgi:hypothetical protein